MADTIDDTAAPPAPSAPTASPGAGRPALPPRLLAALAARGQAQAVAKGSCVVAEGEPAQAMYLVHEGTLRVYVGGADGSPEVELNRLGPGDHFGELMLASERRTASVQATSAARLTRVTRAAFEAALAAEPDLAFHVIQQLIGDVRRLSRHVQGLVADDVYARMVRLFGELAQAQDGQHIVPGPITQQQIARRVGASRSMVHRILHDLADGGYIVLAPAGIVLRRPLPRRW